METLIISCLLNNCFIVITIPFRYIIYELKNTLLFPCVFNLISIHFYYAELKKILNFNKIRTFINKIPIVSVIIELTHIFQNF